MYHAKLATHKVHLNQGRNKRVQTLAHPRSGVPVTGMPLAIGALLREDDVYDSGGGIWEICPCVGLRLGSTQTIWIRPNAELSKEAASLLSYLNQMGGDLFGCIGERAGVFYVIPSPTFNWDARIDIQSQRVTHPECIQELIDYGYLTFGQHAPSNWLSEYSTVLDGRENSVYILTEEGKRKGAQLLEV